MIKVKHIVVVAICAFAPLVSPGYQVWMSSLRIPSAAAYHLDEWKRVGPQIEGMNFNFAPGSDQLSDSERAIVLNHIAGSQNGLIPYNRPETTEVMTLDQMKSYIEPRLQRWGLVDTKWIMLSNRGDNWYYEEAVALDNWLKAEHPGVKLAYNARNMGATHLERLQWGDIIQMTCSEDSPIDVINNYGNRMDLIMYHLQQDATKNDPYYLHLLVKNFEDARLMLRAIGNQIAANGIMTKQEAFDWLASDNVILMLINDGYDEFLENAATAPPDNLSDWYFLPEHNVSGDAYIDTFTSLALSLIEQEDMLTDPNVTEAQCLSHVRTNYRQAVMNGSVTNASTWNLGAPAVADDQIWHTKSYTVGANGAAPGATVDFNGETMVINTNGTLAANASGITMTMRDVYLYGGTIHANQSGAFAIDLEGNDLKFFDGTLKGGSTSAANLVLQNGTVTGAGTIAITADAANGGAVEFASSMDMSAFMGRFAVSSNGLLKLPDLSESLFNVVLSGTGKLANDSTVVLNGLTMDGEVIPGGIYAYADFTPAQQTFLANTTGLIYVIGSPTAVASGGLNDAAVWPVSAPIAGDPNTWHTGSNTLTVATEAFYGKTLVVDVGGVINPRANSSTLTLGNLVLDGGSILNTRLNQLSIDLAGHTFTLNSGSIQAGKDTSRHIAFKNGALLGSGDITISGVNPSGNGRVEFADTMDTTGFTGTFNVLSNGTLKLPVTTLPTFDVTVQSGGKIDAAYLYVMHLTLGGVELSPGSYSYAQLPPEQQAYFVNTTGIIHVYDRSAIRSGSLLDPTIWLVSPPMEGDTNTWKTGPYTLSVESDIFDGDTLEIQPGGSIQPSTASSVFEPNNLHLNGGTIRNTRLYNFTVDFNGKVFTLDSGFLSAGKSSDRKLIFRDGIATGSGTVNITAESSSSSSPVVFESTMNLAGFTGTFNILSNGVFVLPDVSTPSFSITVETNGLIDVQNLNVQNLELNGTALFPGTYTYGDLSTEQQAHFKNTAVTINVTGSLGPQNFTAENSGGITDLTTWDETLPISGDAHTWYTSTNTLQVSTPSSGNTHSFYGGTLVVQPNGGLIPSAGGQSVVLNNLVLDGGSIINTRLYSLNFDLGGKTFTLNSGTLSAGKLNNDRDILFRNAVLAGSGSIDITAVNGAGFNVEFADTVDTHAFSGVFNVITNGTLYLSMDSITNASFGIKLSSNGKLNATGSAALKLAYLEIDGVALPAGTYAYGYFTAAQQAHLINPAMTIEIINLHLDQWLSSKGLTEVYGDDDHDGFLNIFEYSNGGDPTDPSNNGHVPSYAVVANASTNWFEYVHTERKAQSNAPPMFYVLERSASLTNGWTTSGIEAVGFGWIDSDFKSVTNRVLMNGNDQQFLRLRIE